MKLRDSRFPARSNLKTLENSTVILNRVHHSPPNLFKQHVCGHTISTEENIPKTKNAFWGKVKNIFSSPKIVHEVSNRPCNDCLFRSPGAKGTSTLNHNRRLPEAKIAEICISRKRNTRNHCITGNEVVSQIAQRFKKSPAGLSENNILPDHGISRRRETSNSRAATSRARYRISVRVLSRRAQASRSQLPCCES